MIALHKLAQSAQSAHAQTPLTGGLFVQCYFVHVWALCALSLCAMVRCFQSEHRCAVLVLADHPANDLPGHKGSSHGVS